MDKHDGGTAEEKVPGGADDGSSTSLTTAGSTYLATEVLRRNNTQANDTETYDRSSQLRNEPIREDQPEDDQQMDTDSTCATCINKPTKFCTLL